MIRYIDLNCDMGEGMPTDAALMPYISSANIACGYHAGDEETLKRTIDLCVHQGVAIGAHPGFNDKANFGRVNHVLSDSELHDLMTAQLHIVKTHCDRAGARLHHVKPHGALYNMAARSLKMSRVLAAAVVGFDKHLVCYGLSGSCMIDAARQAGLVTANEVFADRTYQPDGSLTPRTEKNALIATTAESVNQVLKMVIQNKVRTVSGAEIPIHPQTICLHGDGDHAVSFAEAIHSRLKENNIIIQHV